MNEFFYIYLRLDIFLNISLKVGKKNGSALQYVKKQTPEICLAAVKQNGYALEFVKQQTSEICLAAVKGNNTSVMSAKLMHVWPEFQEACKDAIKNNKLSKSKKR